LGAELNAMSVDHAVRVVSLSIWRQLYAMVWLAFLQIVIILESRIPVLGSYLVYGHVFLGLVILGLAHYNNAQIKKTDAPNRLKRIAKSTAILATIQPIFGVILLVNLMLRSAIPAPLVGIVLFLHIITALAIITQASSVATAYDMWEEKEYTKT
jgi:hypothetical protein